MKRTCWLLCLFMGMLVSCTPEVDMFADYEPRPIVYGLLDARADTNYIKITRSYYPSGAYDQTANTADSNYYPGKLDARLVEFCNGDSIREIILDTITVFNKEEGVFYAPAQKLYYTAERLKENTDTKLYRYKLKVVLPDRVLTAETDMVGKDNFDVQSLGVDFSKCHFGLDPRSFRFRPATNAVMYEVSMAFTFKEQRTPAGDSVPRTFSWSIGTYTDTELQHTMEYGCYIFRYRPEIFYQNLEEFIGGDTCTFELRRFISDYPVEITIASCGFGLWLYYNNNFPTEGFHPGYSEFSLINGGNGVFSSRAIVRHKVRLAGETVPDLLAVTKWGFRFIGGED